MDSIDAGRRDSVADAIGQVIETRRTITTIAKISRLTHDTLRLCAAATLRLTLLI